jgi:hypothetical protein
MKSAPKLLLKYAGRLSGLIGGKPRAEKLIPGRKKSDSQESGRSALV